MPEPTQPVSTELNLRRLAPAPVFSPLHQNTAYSEGQKDANLAPMTPASSLGLSFLSVKLRQEELRPYAVAAKMK